MKKDKIFKVRKIGSKVFNPNIERQQLYKTKEWTDYRFRFLHHNPICYACGDKSNVVDHLQPHKGNVPLFEKNDNHIPLCNLCHNTITGKFDRISVPDTQGKLRWIQEMRIKKAITVRVKVIPYRKQ